MDKSGVVDEILFLGDDMLNQEICFSNSLETSGFDENFRLVTETDSDDSSRDSGENQQLTPSVEVKVNIYAPGLGHIPFHRIENKSMLVKKEVIEKIIDQKYLPLPVKDPIYDAIIPICCGIVYKPPIEDHVEKEYNSESEDELLTSYTSTGHFYLIKQ